MIKEKLNELISRQKPPIYTEVTVENSAFGKHKLKNKYMICDSCGEKIYIDIPKDKRIGGTMELNYSLTHKEDCLIAVCNKCVIPVINEF